MKKGSICELCINECKATGKRMECSLFEASDKLYQCPCCPATKCIMNEPCLGCETYGEWALKRVLLGEGKDED